MPRALWKDTVIAESDRCIVVEGNQYFPSDDVKHEFLQYSATRTQCAWKGQASYYDIVVNGQVNHDAAWFYADPKPAAGNIKGYIAFWKGVTIEE